ncbi:MAG: hypothetical protein IJJ50_00485 [Lachnospiraceae bacterium]|nr:hypothetical protein [Lachnospiraceae bacterium]
MPAFLGHIIAIALLAVPVFFAGRYCWRNLRGALKNEGCGDCGGNCSSCGCGCSSDGKLSGKGNKGDNPHTGEVLPAARKSPARYGINGKIVIIPAREDLPEEHR